MAMLTATSGARSFYKPATYRWYLESLSLVATLRPSQSTCRVLGKVTPFPVTIRPETMSEELRDRLRNVLTVSATRHE
jgi:hypothetical protein